MEHIKNLITGLLLLGAICTFIGFVALIIAASVKYTGFGWILATMTVMTTAYIMGGAIREERL